MAFRKYSVQVNLMLIAILLCCLGMALSLFVFHWYISSGLLVIVLVVLSRMLLKLVKSNNEKLSRQIELIMNSDFSHRYPEKNQGLAFDRLHQSLNRLNDYLRSSSHQKVLDSSLFEITIDLLPIGILIFRENQPLFLNQIAGEFLNIKSPKDQKQLKERAPFFVDRITELREKGKADLKLHNKGELQQWRMEYRHFTVDKIPYELFIFKNYQRDSERTEEEISNRLMHVLTHEIMNSISPVSSLTDTLNEQLQRLEKNIAVTEEFQDIKTSAQIIKKRSEGLSEFVERYSLLARLPRLKKSFVEVSEITREVEQLVLPQFNGKGIDFICQKDSRKLRFRADRQLLVQVVLNLLKNAEEAFTDRKDARIMLNFSSEDGYNYISVSDNAGGVAADIQENIFLPFFTTKDKASGIGLSLSRKIIQAHSGRLYLRHLKGGSEFRIELPD